MVIMKTVSVTELKTHLSKYLREIRRGGEVQILDRGVPIARLTQLSPASDEHDESQRRRMIKNGLLRPGGGGTAAVLETAPLELPTSLMEALDEERADRL